MSSKGPVTVTIQRAEGAAAESWVMLELQGTIETRDRGGVSSGQQQQIGDGVIDVGALTLEKGGSMPVLVVGYADLGTAFQANIDAETARQRKDLEQQQEKTPPETVTPPAPATQEATGIEALRKENAELKAKIAALEAVRWQRPTGETDDGSSPRMNQLLAPPDIRVEAISRPGTAAPEHKATSTERDEELARWAALVRLRDQQIKEKMEAYDLLMHEVVALRSQMQEMKRAAKRDEEQPDEVPLVVSPREVRMAMLARTQSQTTQKLRRQLASTFPTESPPQETVIPIGNVPPTPARKAAPAAVPSTPVPVAYVAAEEKKSRHTPRRVATIGPGEDFRRKAQPPPVIEVVEAPPSSTPVSAPSSSVAMDIAARRKSMPPRTTLPLAPQEDDLAAALRQQPSEVPGVIQPLRVGNDLPPLRQSSGGPSLQPQPVSLRQMRAESAGFIARRGADHHHH